ncbi:MAG: hypothetical protein AAF226_02550, partial [Verrucomicrobiota bacterium]
MRLKSLMLVLVAVAIGWVNNLAGEEYRVPLGYPIEITDLYIPGAEVEPLPRKDQAGALVVRILQVKPAKDGFRYDLSLYGLDPGRHNVINYLQIQQTGDSLQAEPVYVEITVSHSLDQLPRPTELKPKPLESLGGYTQLMIGIGVVWLVGLLILIFYRKNRLGQKNQQLSEPTL